MQSLLMASAAWSEIPGPDHYADYVRWLGIMLARYAPIATSVEVSNENDGCELISDLLSCTRSYGRFMRARFADAYFANDKLPLGYDLNYLSP